MTIHLLVLKSDWKFVVLIIFQKSKADSFHQSYKLIAKTWKDNITLLYYPQKRYDKQLSRHEYASSRILVYPFVPN